MNQCTVLNNTLAWDVAGRRNKSACIDIDPIVLYELKRSKKRIEMPRYNQRTLDAMDEARRISRDPDVRGYTNMDELRKALEE